MSVTTSAGALFGVSAAAPASYDQSGYEALTFTTVGEITDLGEIPSRVYELVTHQPVATRGVQKLKGGYNLGSQTITLAIDPEDAGQMLLDTATNSDSPVSISIKHPTLGTIFARALVMGGPKNYGDVNSTATRTVTLEYTIAEGGNDGVVVAPAGP